MNEFFASNRLGAYLDGELSPAEAAELERALQQNPELRDELERLQATIGFVREHGPVQAPPGFHARVMEKVADEPLPGGFWARLRRMFTVVPMETVAVAVAAIVVAVVIGQRLEPDSPSVEPTVEQGEASQASAQGEEAKEGSSQADKMETAANSAAELLVEGTSAPEKAQPPEPQLAHYEDARTRKELPGGDAIAETVELAKEGLPSTEGVATLVGEEVGSGDPGRSSSSGAGAIPDAIALQAAMAYRLTTDDPKALRLLESLTARHGGTVVDAYGKPLNGALLGESGERRSLVLIIDPAELSGLAKDLETMGQVTPMSADPTQLVGGAETIRVHVDLSYQP